MSSTHLSLHYHFVFSTKSRIPYIADSWQSRLHSYLGGTVRGLLGVAEEVGGIHDHVHILASLGAVHRIADVARELKSCSSKWVHDVIGNRRFGWQDGYGAFTASRSELPALRAYIRGQQEHHRHRTFQEEYLELIQQSGIEFDERFLW